MKIERKPTGHQTMNFREGGKLKTYHEIKGMWGEMLWDEGEWGIYRPVLERSFTYPNRPPEYGTTRGYHSVLVHSKIWIEDKIVEKTELQTRARMRGEETEIIEREYFETERIEMVCHTNIYPVTQTNCWTCHAPIPEGAVATWKMLNWEHLREEG